MLRVHDAGTEKSNGYVLTIYASFSPSLRFPRSVKKKKHTARYSIGRWSKKFLGISNTPEVFIAKAGHVSGARRQKFEITCSDVRILRHTCLSLFLSLPFPVHLSPPRFLLVIIFSRNSVVYAFATLGASHSRERPARSTGRYLSAYGRHWGGVERKHAVAGLRRARNLQHTVEVV